MMLSVIASTPHRPVRHLVRAAAVAVPATFVLLSPPAGANVPEGWSDPEPVDALGALALLAGVPLLLFALITLAVYLPSLASGERRTSAGPEQEWFGGPREGVGATDEVDPAALEGKDTGGASGRW